MKQNSAEINSTNHANNELAKQLDNDEVPCHSEYSFSCLHLENPDIVLFEQQKELNQFASQKTTVSLGSFKEL